MNKKNIIIVSSIIILIIIFLLWKFVIGFKLSMESEIKDIIKGTSDISMYVVDNDEEMFEIDDLEDFNKILNILSTAKVKKSKSLWIGGSYRLAFVNNKTNDVTIVIIHPNQITISNKVFALLNDNGNTYKNIENILNKYMDNVNKFKS
ncbi:MAG: hypothetical protein ACI4ON_07825 [Clostridia bacterium]